MITVGHVGDSRLYLAWDGNLRKVTSDHSPVGEREDMGELTEAAGHAASQPQSGVSRRRIPAARRRRARDFIEVRSFPFRHNAALLLCSDGLSDTLMSSEISAIVETYDGDPEYVAQAAGQAANRAGGKDNISVVFVAGPDFLGTECGPLMRESRTRHAITRVRGVRWRNFAGRVAMAARGVLLGILAVRILSRIGPAKVTPAHPP